MAEINPIISFEAKQIGEYGTGNRRAVTVAGRKMAVRAALAISSTLRPKALLVAENLCLRQRGLLQEVGHHYDFEDGAVVAFGPGPSEVTEGA